MTRITLDPTTFREDMLDGLVLAFPAHLERVPGASGVRRAGGPRQGKVAVIIGGGCGHYPAFSGLVGAGLADAAVVGDVFTSPSAVQAERVARGVEGGAGVLFSFGNYAGDVMNFGVAETRLHASGIGCATVLVTDDVASAPPDEQDRRRGIAGGLAVFRTAGAAADGGASLAEVERIAVKANAATRTLGIAFGACTLPGRTEPLFDVAPGYYELGLGIHGEAGIEAIEAVPIGELARLLVAPVLAERPTGADGRVVAILNGLGATKYEELFVLWRSIVPLLDAAGLDLVASEVGELVTSLDMAGCSLSLYWLDDELAELWARPADAPAFRRGDITTLPTFPLRASPAAAGEDLTPASAPRRLLDAPTPAAAVARRALQAMLTVLEAHEDELGHIDAVAGDGDHGTGMTRGARAALEATEGLALDVGPLLVVAGREFADRAGGTSGILWGLLLETIGDTFATTVEPGAALVAGAVRKGTAAVARVGRAGLGDKTMLDVLEPFSDRLAAATDDGASLAVAWRDAAGGAGPDAAATAGLRPRVGRARPLAERSVGTPDAGAVSMALCVGAVAAVLDAAGPTDSGSTGSGIGPTGTGPTGTGPTGTGPTDAGTGEVSHDREETQP